MGLLTTVAQYTSDYTYTTSSSSGSEGAFALFALIYVAVIVLMVVSVWKVFVKAGRPGWAAIVPVYNTWVLFEIVGYPGWWVLLSFIPIVNFFPAVMAIVSYFKLAKLFGKSTGFAVCNIFFSLITMPILGFGSAKFQGTVPAVAAPVAPVVPVAPVAPAAPQTPDAPQASAPTDDSQSQPPTV